MPKDKKAIKKDILDKFRSIKDGSDYIISSMWLEYQYLETLTPIERKIFGKAVQELVKKGIVEASGDIPHKLKLTEKGVNLIL